MIERKFGVEDGRGKERQNPTRGAENKGKTDAYWKRDKAHEYGCLQGGIHIESK